ncbi:MAG TPA: LytTR family DNA-binding domain-containing protein [Pseudonocardiaceae bacterium]|jgi:DNA-binding LytR/AlgR family response regulator|nr:LytTR family DNA-binding domain-containing protein [Pseudonocardiaceae bacterium]
MRWPEIEAGVELPPRAVRYVETHGDYVRLHLLHSNRSHLVRIPLRVLEQRWRDAGFVRIHRSYLVALALVTELRANGCDYVVRLDTDSETDSETVELSVSRRYVRELKDKLKGLASRPTDAEGRKLVRDLVSLIEITRKAGT